jgi:hypothetical protein
MGQGRQVGGTVRLFGVVLSRWSCLIWRIRRRLPIAAATKSATGSVLRPILSQIDSLPSAVVVESDQASDTFEKCVPAVRADNRAQPQWQGQDERRQVVMPVLRDASGDGKPSDRANINACANQSNLASSHGGDSYPQPPPVSLMAAR